MRTRRGAIESEPIDWPMVEENMGLVYMFVNRAHPTLYWGEDIDDLVQDATFGLIRATQKYDPTLGWKFSTYAQHWIKQAMQRGVQQRNGLTTKARGLGTETVSLDSLLEGGDTRPLTDRLPADDDTEGDALAAVLVEELLCDDDRDLFDGSLREVAERRGVSPEAIRTRRVRTRSRLADLHDALAS